MSDLLCLAKEQALSSINPRLFTIATLTGHVCHFVTLLCFFLSVHGQQAHRAYGDGYSIVMDNGPAHKASIHCRLFDNG